MLPIHCPKCTALIVIDDSKDVFWCGYCHQHFTREEVKDFVKYVVGNQELREKLTQLKELNSKLEILNTQWDLDEAPEVLQKIWTVKAERYRLDMDIKLDQNYKVWKDESEEKASKFEERFEWNANNRGDVVIEKYKKYNGDQKKLVIPSEFKGNPVISISDNAFAGCDCLREVVISANVKKIGKYAFLGCRNMYACTVISDKTEIDTGAFGQCCGDLQITAPDNSAAHEYALSNFLHYAPLPELEQ